MQVDVALDDCRATAPAPVAERGGRVYDVFAVAEVHVPPGRRAAINTGVVLDVPPDARVRVESIPGVVLSTGAAVVPVTVGSGLLKIVCINHDPFKTYVAKPGFRVARLVLDPDVELNSPFTLV